MSALTDDVQAFRHYVRSERGLADNTLLAYGRDLDRFALWAQMGGLADYAVVPRPASTSRNRSSSKPTEMWVLDPLCSRAPHSPFSR